MHHQNKMEKISGRSSSFSPGICLLTLFAAVILCSFNANDLLSDDTSVQMLALDRKIGQLIMPGIPGTAMDYATGRMIARYHPGGILLYGRNTRERSQIIALTEALQQKSLEAGDPPLFISIDQEGGRVKRVTDAVTQFPGNMALGAADDPLLTAQVARITGIQLRLLGINMNLAPSVDVNSNPMNPIINIRSFGSSPDKVAKHGEAYIRGLQRARCLAVAKHFPGHGNTEQDSHKTLPVISYGIDKIRSHDLVPFRAAIGANVSSIMSAHIRFPALDEDSATVSPRIMTRLLKDEMSYRGLVMTDDLEMGAIAGNMSIGEAAVRAVLAGSDILLISSHANRVGEIHHSLKEACLSGRISPERLEMSVAKIQEYKKIYQISLLPDQYRMTLSDEDVKLLMNAEKINSTVSASSLFLYQGNVNNEAMPKNKMPFVYSDNAVLRSLCREQGITVYPRRAYWTHEQNVARAAQKSMNQDLLPDRVIAFYEVRDIDRWRELPPAAEDLVLISPDNAFLVSTRLSGQSVLFSFSDTRASYQAIVDVISSLREPKHKIPIDLGFSASHE